MRESCGLVAHDVSWSRRGAHRARGARLTAKFAAFFHSLIEGEVNIPPSQFEALFVSLAHSDADIDATLAAVRQGLGPASHS
jgi:glutamate-1-semialdehyde aminotransferase